MGQRGRVRLGSSMRPGTWSREGRVRRRAGPPHRWSFVFFFSSRRRHTRLVSDWSSDVCSSDLVMAQIALSLMLLFSAGLFFRGALKASGLNPGFVAAGDLVTEMDFSLIRKDPAEARRLIFETVRRARDLPGVRTAALGTMLPYGNFTNSRRIMSMRETLPTDPKAPDPGAGALFTATTPGYFDAIGVKLCAVVTSPRPKLKTEIRRASRSLTTRWQRKFFRIWKQSVSTFVTPCLRKTVRLTTCSWSA